jgi:hypothetical protein
MSWRWNDDQPCVRDGENSQLDAQEEFLHCRQTLTSLSFIIKSLGIKRRCEMRPTQEKVNPGKKRGWSVLSEWLWEAKRVSF